MKNVRIYPTTDLRGTLEVPGDKSISHRAVMLASLAEGRSVLRGLLKGEDVLATVRCFRAMGVKIEINKNETVIEGPGMRGLKAPAVVLDCGNSGTTMRLMMGILAGLPFISRLTGDASLNRRPMDRVIRPLQTMGASIQEFRASDGERVVRIEGRPLRGIEYTLPVASAQVKSAILLAGLYAQGGTKVLEPVPTRNHTEIMMRHCGIDLECDGTSIQVKPATTLDPMDLQVPGDISSAAFFLVGGCFGRRSDITLLGVGVNPTRTGVLEVLASMGARIEQLNPRRSGGETLADLRVRSVALHGTRIEGKLIPRLIDEIPALSVAAAGAEGSTQIRDAAELRVKETDRIQALEQELSKLSVNIKQLQDGLEIRGPATFTGGDLNSHGDHRIAMSLALAATQGRQASQIRDVECVQTSYPDFFSHLGALGARVEWLPDVK